MAGDERVSIVHRGRGKHGNSSVFRHPVAPIGFSYVLAEWSVGP
jgi:hypothetical protein